MAYSCAVLGREVAPAAVVASRFHLVVRDRDAVCLPLLGGVGNRHGIRPTNAVANGFGGQHSSPGRAAVSRRAALGKFADELDFGSNFLQAVRATSPLTDPITTVQQDAIRRWAAANVATLLYDQTANASTSSPAQFGVGPEVQFTTSSGGSSLLGPTIAPGNPPVYIPQLQLNSGNSINGDIVAGTYGTNANFPAAANSKPDSTRDRRLPTERFLLAFVRLAFDIAKRHGISRADAPGGAGKFRRSRAGCELRRRLASLYFRTRDADGQDEPPSAV